MPDSGFRRDVETGLANFRTAIHRSSLFLANAATIPLSIIASSLIDLTYKSNLDWDPAYLIFAFTFLIIIFNSVYALNRNIETDAENDNVGYPNLYTFGKATGGILVMAFFTAIDNELKNINKFTAITLCLSVYFYLLISMILFKLGEDFDLTGSFLAACVSLFYEKAQGWEIVYLLSISMLLASLKCYLLGGKGLVVPNSLPPPVMVDTRFRGRNEKRLATLRTVVRNSSLGLAYAATFTLSIFGLSLLLLCYQYNFSLENMVCICFIFLLYTLFHFIYARNRIVYTYEVRDNVVYPNLYAIIKGMGGKLIIFAFIAMENWLKGINRFYAITFCTTIYLYLVIAMLFFRISEDCDLAGAFLAAAYMLFYENSKGLEILSLIIISIVLAALKGFLVGGESLGDPSDRLPQLRLGGRPSQSR